MSVDNVPIEIKGNYVFNNSDTTKSWSWNFDFVKVGNLSNNDLSLNTFIPVTNDNVGSAKGNCSPVIRSLLLGKSINHMGGMHNLLINSNTSNENINSGSEKIETEEQPQPQTLGGKKKSSHKSKSTQKRKQKKNNKTRFAQRKR